MSVIVPSFTSRRIVSSYRHSNVEQPISELTEMNIDSLKGQDLLQGLLKATLSPEKDKFLITIPLEGFRPEDLLIKIVEGTLIIEAKQETTEDKPEKCTYQKHIERRIVLPKSVDLDAMTSTLSSDGVLTISAPNKIEKDRTKERIIEIETSHVQRDTKKESTK